MELLIDVSHMLA